MRVERNANQHSYNCWLTADEYDELRRSIDSYRDELVIRFGGEIGFRSFEIPQIKPTHVRREMIENENFYFLRVPQGKDTTGSGGKPRDAYLPRDVERDLHRYQRADSIDDEDPVIDANSRTIQRIVKAAAERTADRTGDEDLRKVSSHDLRPILRSFVSRPAPHESPRRDGDRWWDDYQSLEPSLNKPSTETIVAEFDHAGMV